MFSYTNDNPIISDIIWLCFWHSSKSAAEVRSRSPDGGSLPGTGLRWWVWSRAEWCWPGFQTCPVGAEMTSCLSRLPFSLMMSPYIAAAQPKASAASPADLCKAKLSCRAQAVLWTGPALAACRPPPAAWLQWRTSSAFIRQLKCCGNAKHP